MSLDQRERSGLQWVDPASGVLRVGVIAVGTMGRDHVRTLTAAVPGARVSMVSDVDAAAAREVAGKVGADVAADAAALIESPDVDAVLICSPDPTHESLVLACLAAGKPVLCEKPLAVSVEGTGRIVAAELALGRRLVQVGFMRRYDPGLLALRRTINSGALGEVTLVHCTHRNAVAGPGTTPESIVTNSMIHELDQVPWLLGEDVVAVSVAVARGRKPTDPVLAGLTMRSGALVQVEVSVAVGYGYDVRCEVLGTTGSATAMAPVSGAVRLDGVERTAVPTDFRQRFADAYRLELVAWAAGVRAGRLEGPSAWDGHAATALAASCLEALHSGVRVPVTPPARPELYRT
jgi:myo-inositol 2-dehydrogenase / D-chiro-inositol 1-dehydrogenase